MRIFNLGDTGRRFPVADAPAADWRLRRAAIYEGARIEQEMQDATNRVERNAALLPYPGTAALVERYDTKHRNDRNRVLREFERLQDRRRHEAHARKASQAGDIPKARSLGAGALPPPQPLDGDGEPV